MTDSRREPTALSPGAYAALVVAVIVLAIGLVFGRSDVAILAFAPAVWFVLALFRARPVDVDVAMEVRAGAVNGADALIRATSDADLVQLVVVQGGRRPRQVLLPGTGEAVTAHSELLHSGPALLAAVSARALDADGVIVGTASRWTEGTFNAMPDLVQIPQIPLAPRLTGLTGSHQGVRQGHGGEFRDIHPFRPGDELRRIDWRATARAARRPDDLLVRRTDALSDASVVIAIDDADDLGAVVASWGTGDVERSGVTSLDNARQAARAIAETAVGAGDRVAYHELTPGGRSVRSGAGPRHLARVLATVAATTQRGTGARVRRSPHMPSGSVIYVLATFVDGAAVQATLDWRAAGHRVIAIDVLPSLITERLTAEQLLALRIVRAERTDVFGDLERSGVEVVTWNDEAPVRLRELMRRRR